MNFIGIIYLNPPTMKCYYNFHFYRLEIRIEARLLTCTSSHYEYIVPTLHIWEDGNVHAFNCLLDAPKICLEHLLLTEFHDKY